MDAIFRLEYEMKTINNKMEYHAYITLNWSAEKEGTISTTTTTKKIMKIVNGKIEVGNKTDRQ